MTISEIAKMAEVSPAAVSRYLNQGYVSEEKAERIKKVIEETGYVPSAQARILRTKKTKVIGVIIPKIDSESVSRMVSGITSELSKNGYEILLANTANDTNKEIDYLGIFDHSRVDGIILIATIITKTHEKILKSLKVPVVVLGQEVQFASCIYHDDYGAARKLTETLIQTGRKKFGFIGVDLEDQAAGHSRYQGFVDELKEENMKCNKKAFCFGEFTMESGYEQAKKLMKVAPETNVIFCATDNIAVGAMMYFREQNIRIPDDVMISGVGHTKMSTVVTPSLTTVHYYYKTSGIEAAKAMLEKLEKPDTPMKQMKLSFEVIENQSTSN